MGSPPPPFVSETPVTPLRIVFMGTPALAAHILERMIAAAGTDFIVAGVVTRPDQPRKRGLKLEPSEVGAVAERAGLPTLKPVKIRTPEFLAELKSFAPDLLVVAAYGRILPNSVLEAPRLMPINVHASLLPRHRGAAPIEGAILAGDRESGVTIMRVIERMDAGPILWQRAITLSAKETQGTLKEKLAEVGAEALLEAIAQFRNGSIVETSQDESLVTYSAPIAKEQSVIDWSGDAVHIERMVRAFDPWPVARTTIGGEDLLIWRARVIDDPMSNSHDGNSPRNQSRPAVDAHTLDAARDVNDADDSAASETHGAAKNEAHVAIATPGTIEELKPNPVVKCGIGSLALIEVQAAGRRRMAAADYLRGRRVNVGTRLGG
jgi:methionyl-tRNA formyltransferase